MKDNEVIEILDDGTVYYFDLAVCDQQANAVIEELLEKQNTVPNYDFTATMFSLFVKSVYFLREAGWLTEELIDEIVDASESGEEDEADD